MKPLRIIVIALAVVIVGMLGILIFGNPAKGPTTSNDLPSTVTPAPTSTSMVAGTSSTPPVKTTHHAVFSPSGEIAVTAPALDALIASPVTIEGQAPNTWYFEASFPIKILDGDGTVLGQGPAQAESDWTTPGTVSFKATLIFTKPKYATGTILFHNDNPSGDPARDKEFSFPVKFK